MTLEQVNNRIEELKMERTRVIGRETEVYARIVGYYRSVKNWNKGKKEEYGIRVNFSDFQSSKIESFDKINTEKLPLSLVKPVNLQKDLFSHSTEKTTSYLYFFRETCPNCPPVSTWLDNSDINGRKINVDRESGMHEARRYEITAAPTVVFLDEKGRETSRGNTVNQLENLFGIAAAAGA